MLQSWRKVMGQENCDEDMDMERERSHKKMLQSHVRIRVRARCLAEFKTADGLMNFFGAVNFGSLAGAWKKDSRTMKTISVTAGTE
jgi:hypothetical protein